MKKINISEKFENIKNIIKTNKSAIVCSILIIMSVISIIIQKNDRQQAITINSTTLESKDNKIAVYITGEIKNPGVYYLNPNSRLESVIDIAGGITQIADISKINLSKKLVDSDKVVIPKKQIENDAVNTNNNEESSEDIVNTNKMSTDKVNINEASKDEIMTLKGIGESTADKIIEYRKNQKFKKIEDIMNVKGIGQNKYNLIKDNICI